MSASAFRVSPHDSTTKPSRTPPLWRRRVTAALLAGLFAAPLGAATLTWDGGGANNNWSTVANWNPDQAPVSGDWLTFAGAVRTTPFNNLSGLTVDRVFFQTGASSFTLSGNAFTIKATTPGNGGFIHNGSANLQTINNNLTFDGSVSINYLTSPTAGPLTLNGTISMVNNGAMTVGGASTVTLNGAISGTGTASGIALDALAPLVLLNGANTYTGSTRIFSGSTLRLGANSRISDFSTVSVSGTLDLNGFSEIVGGLTGSGTVQTGGGLFQVSNDSANSFGGAITGSGSFSKAGTGELTLGGSNTHTGGTNVYQGTLRISQFSTNALPDTGPVLVQGGTLTVDVVTETVGAVTLDGGTIGGSGVLAGSGFALRSGTVSGRLGGAGGITKTTSGTVTISGTHAYGGATSIQGGTLALGASNTLPNGTAVTISGGATLGMGTFSDTVGTVTLTDGSITGTGTLTGTSFSVASGTVGVPLAGSGATLTKTGAGTVTLNGANTYTGATTVSAGVLALGGSNLISDSSALAVAAGATFRLNNNSETVAQLSGSGAVELGSGRLTVAGGTTTFSGVLSGTGGLTRQGSGTLTLSGANTYTGQTQVTGGTLALGASNALADASALSVAGGTFGVGSFSDKVGAVTLASGALAGTTGVLESDAGFTVQSGAVSARLGGAGGLLKNGADVATLSGANVYLGATGVTQGTLRLLAGGGLPDSTALTVSGGAVFDLNGVSDTVGSLAGAGAVATGTGATLTVGANGQSTAFSGTFSGAPNGLGQGGLAKTGAGTLTFSGLDLHTGTTRVDQGTLALPAGMPIAGGTISVQPGAALTAQGVVNRPLQSEGTVTATGTLIVGALGGPGAMSLGGTLVAGGHLVQLVGAGAVELRGAVQLAQGGRLTALDQAAGMVLQATGSVSASGDAAIDGAFVNRGTVQGPAGAGQFLAFSDDVSGPGSYTGNVRFGDGFSPGASPAAVSFQNVAFDDSSELLIELGGRAPGSQFDVLDVAGHAALAGRLRVELIDGFVPSPGDRFAFMTFGTRAGDFGSFTGLALGGGLYLAPQLGDHAYVLAAVPEPSTYALLLAGLGVLGFMARRRRS